MLSSNFCNYCYCIRGLKRCVQPKCHLAVENCEPQFTSQYDCCPASYACSCWKEGKLYMVGEPIPGIKDCETCFCSPRGPLCQRIECPAVALDCEPVIPQGHCCPTEFICNKTEAHKGTVYQVDGADKSIHHPLDSPPDGHKGSQSLLRRTDDTLDYNSVPQPAYRPPTTQETPLRESDFGTDKTTTASHTELPSPTTTVMPVTRFAPTPITGEKQPVFQATNSEKQGISTRPPFEPTSPKPMTEESIGGLQV
ncbi:hypothetical protein MTO96_009994 [Rhipicephalus appendiculatus]